MHALDATPYGHRSIRRSRRSSSPLLVALTGLAVLAAACSSTPATSAPTAPGDLSIGPATPTTRLITPLPGDPAGSLPSGAASPWTITTSACSDPAKAQALITGTIEIGTVAPQTGGLATVVYAPLTTAFKAYIDHANADKLLGDLHLDLVVADDQGDPAFTPVAVNGLIAAGVNVVSGIIGSANNLAVRDQLNRACMPQLMALGTSSRLGDVGAAPWTMGGLVPVTVETTVYVDSIVRLQGEESRVALLVSNDGDGQTFSNAFIAAAANTGLTIVDKQLVQPGVIDPPNAQLLQIASQRPDTIVASLSGAACATFLTELGKVRAALGGWNPAVYMSSGCADGSILSLAGDAAGGVLSSTNLTTDEPTFDTAMTAAGVTSDLALAAEGWTAAEVTVAIIRQAQQSPDGLTRVSIMEAARNLSYAPSLALPGVRYDTNGVDDPFPAESLQVIQFDASTRTFTDVGPLVAQFES